MKIVVEIELVKASGPRLDAEVVAELLLEDLEALGPIWMDDTEFEVRNVKRITKKESK